MNTYYHRFYEQELGFRRGAPRQAGSYMLISKKAVKAGFFPRLSSSVLNPRQGIEIRSPDIPPTVCEFVYNNDSALNIGAKSKIEYRLNINALVRSHPKLFCPDHIVRITKNPSAPNTVIMEFLLFNSEEHADINKFLKPKNNNYFPGIDDPLDRPDPVDSDLIAGEPQIAEEAREPLLKSLLKKQMIDPERLKKITTGNKISRDPAFRELVIQQYDSRCAFSGLRIERGLKNSLIAAHIYPVSLAGSDNPRNGLALSRDLHWAFDEGAISVAEDLTLMIHEEWGLFEVPGVEAGKKIFLPEDSGRHPFKEALDFHRKQIYGLFLK